MSPKAKARLAGVFEALEGLTWRLVFGVNSERWKEQASAARARRTQEAGA